jgi:hypothetical protein
MPMMHFIKRWLLGQTQESDPISPRLRFGTQGKRRMSFMSLNFLSAISEHNVALQEKDRHSDNEKSR